MDLNKILLWGLIISTAVIVIVSIQPYILGTEPSVPGTGTIVKVFSIILGVMFVIMIVYVNKNKTLKKYKGMDLLAYALGMLSIAFLLFTGLLVGNYSGFLPVSVDLPLLIDQILIPLRTISIYFAIAGILMLLSLLISKKASEA
ncbi:MAG: hypothetical protein GW779_02470 [Candidatus Altiarchaeum hamiconexum]|uniref:Uncharacterized protein n=1 Tax=Candidatus Altarchaeum hamiconexum TaxID=1803513 RepID=A0A8J7YVV8_9ARCH|nr:hypothetical protein [Candidatus Altarchaeum hamiconexum]OIQ06353.1 MAG: hypothetical protein AUK59_00170 [Candidatus Altarchaeum sp. CG2_30_32_3053]PIN67023.1 MAG: hypothetical protein COV98_05130 [Candidatus Altarchaeum sp. CG12_big_fil_rev_8_21_14_0_65_33_22]PIV27269.1 MAG: hypothetical protein COS36_06340 [Candidatus Altarchaeum sp. CG03_land_8_20_14_0_80_32_618]PIX48188.1 MAG: hypothetical protein COZ53_04785 [Candidatus Altarchaeum sp. CG_4_8_14_3_um_filter_33_2054]PIZ31687.1 MAG: hyp